jgi:hypothetical protein
VRAVDLILNKLFAFIDKVMAKVVGPHKKRKLKIRDHKLFGFLKEHEFKF